MINYLHVMLREVESVRNDVEYWFHVIRAIYLVCPKGYIELQALCHALYGDKAEKYLHKMEQVGVKVMEPVLMKWTEEGASVLRHRIVVPCYVLTKTECLYIATKFNDEAYQCEQEETIKEIPNLFCSSLTYS